MSTTQPKRKDGTHMLFMGLIFAVVIIAFIVGANLNAKADHDARVSEYSSALSGRGLIDVDPDRGPLIILLIISAVIIAGLIAWWVYELKAIDAFNANTRDNDVIDELFGTTRELVSYQIKRGSMSHATVVTAAREHGYVLDSQGQDGSLVFRAIDETVN